MDTHTLQKRIMRKVYLVYCLKKACSGTACRLYMLLFLGVLLASVVSIGSVIANVPKTWDLMYVYDFGMAAFMHTELIVQMLILGIIGVGSWMAMSALRNVRPTAYSLRTN